MSRPFGGLSNPCRLRHVLIAGAKLIQCCKGYAVRSCSMIRLTTLSQSIGDQEAAIRKAEDSIKLCEQELKDAHAQRNDLQNQRRKLFEAQDAAQKCVCALFPCIPAVCLARPAAFRLATIILTWRGGCGEQAGWGAAGAAPAESEGAVGGDALPCGTLP